jgi:hypothetical protein
MLTRRLNDEFIAVSDGYSGQTQSAAKYVPLRTALSGLIRLTMVGRTVGLNRDFTEKTINTV